MERDEGQRRALDAPRVLVGATDRRDRGDAALQLACDHQRDVAAGGEPGGEHLRPVDAHVALDLIEHRRDERSFIDPGAVYIPTGGAGDPVVEPDLESVRPDDDEPFAVREPIEPVGRLLDRSAAVETVERQHHRRGLAAVGRPGGQVRVCRTRRAVDGHLDPDGASGAVGVVGVIERRRDVCGLPARSARTDRVLGRRRRGRAGRIR